MAQITEPSEQSPSQPSTPYVTASADEIITLCLTRDSSPEVSWEEASTTPGVYRLTPTRNSGALVITRDGRTFYVNHGLLYPFDREARHRFFPVEFPIIDELTEG